MFKVCISVVETKLSRRLVKWSPRYTTTATTVTNSNPVVEYLVNSLGFSRKDAVVTSSKVSAFKSAANSNSVIDFFKCSGLSHTQIQNVVSRSPKLLSCSVDRTLIPKIQALYDLGFSRPHVVRILYECPDVCWRSLDDHIVPTFELLKSVFCVDGDDDEGGIEALLTAVERSNWLLLSVSAKRKLPDVVSLLRSCGLTPRQIRAFSLRKPRYLLFGTQVLERVLIRVEKLGIPRESSMFYHGICAMCSLTEVNLELRMGVYKSYGFTDENLLTLARTNPYALLISESRLRTLLDFFMNDVGYQASEIASIPFVLTLSFEKRVRPRYAVWKCLMEEKRIKRSLTTCLKMNEPRFFETLVLPFKDQFPDLYSDYMKRVRSVTEAAK